MRICKPISYGKATILLDCFFAISKKKVFTVQMYWQIWVDILKYNTSLPSSAALERLVSMVSAVLTAKRPSLTSNNFQWLLF